MNSKKNFSSIVEAMKYYHIKGNNRIIECCKGEAKHAGKDPNTNEKLSWMYYDDYLKLNKEGDNIA